MEHYLQGNSLYKNISYSLLTTSILITKYYTLYIIRRFCCTLDEKKKELPNFDPNTHEDPEYKYIYRRDWQHFGFWNTLLVTSTVVLLLGLMLYIISCLFVEVGNISINEFLVYLILKEVQVYFIGTT